jgi:hypothetical protein
MKCIGPKAGFALIGSLAASLLVMGGARADLNVYVGYGDSLRGSPFFPSPWLGDPNVLFEGSGSPWDAGAFRFDNTGASDVTLKNVSVDHLTDGTVYSIWGAGPLVVHPSEIAIFTQTTQYNFDTSDNAPGHTPGSPAPDQPEIHVNVDGTDTTYTDSGQVLNTGGYDLAAFPNDLIPSGNEALQWRLIGTTGIEDPGGHAPEPGSLALLATGGLPLLGVLRRRRLSA